MNPQDTFEMDKRGIQDATVADFLLPYLVGKLPLGLASRANVAKVPIMPMSPTSAAPDAMGTELREGLMKSMSEPAKGYAYGGVVDDLGQVPMPNEAPPPVQNVPRGTMPSPIQGILSQSQALGTKMAGQYTPDMRNQLYAAMLERQNSMPNALGGALASAGDAIARGYGRSNSDFLDKTMQSQKDTLQGGLNAFDTAQKGSLAQTQAGMELGKMDPGSEISKLHQDAYGEALKSLGYTEDQIKKLPATQIQAIADIGLKRADIEAQEKLKEATINLQGMLGVANIQGTAAKALSDRGLFQRVIDALSKDPAHAALVKQLQTGYTPVTGKTPPKVGVPAAKPIGSKAEYDALPTGTPFKWKDKEGVKP
jgi:hypothetical protein